MSRREAEKKVKLRAVLAGLRKMYGDVSVPRRQPGAGLDMLIEAMLSQNTNMMNAHRGYRMLRRRFKSWTAVMNAEVGDVQREIAICGLARMRARRLQALLRTIKEGQGRLSIDFLANAPVEAAMESDSGTRCCRLTTACCGWCDGCASCGRRRGIWRRSGCCRR
jgi:endonuclease-3